MTKPIKFFLGVTVFGLLIIGLMFVYYYFDLGIKPCQGLPSDASNCGDADFGGVYFILFGVPIVCIGLLGLIISTIWHYLRHRKAAKGL